MIKQAMALSWINVKSFPHRLISSGITIISIACVSAVILGVLTLSDGMIKTMARTGLDNTLLVMRAGAESEVQSVMFPAEVDIMANHQDIVRDENDQPIVSAEMFVSAHYKPEIDNICLGESCQKKLDVKEQNLALRGISPSTYLFRPNFTMVSGTVFKTGLRELIVGQAIARRLPELRVGHMMTLGGTTWLISGIFSDNNSVFESELWADIGMVQSDYQRGNTIQSVRLALKPNAKINLIDQTWQDDPRLNVRILAEKIFFAEQGQRLTRLIRWIGLPVTLVMTLGAIIAALNTMYGAIVSRSREIATHKAIGFSPFAILSSIITEAILLGVLGGLLGVLPLYFVFDGWTAATQNTSSLSQMMFNFDINGSLMSQAMLISISIGLIGGLLPAIKAVRMPVTLGLRQL